MNIRLAPGRPAPLAPAGPAALSASRPLPALPQPAPALQALPAASGAPRLALPALQAAQTAPDAAPAVLFTAGRAAFDSQSSLPVSAEAVPASFSVPTALAPASPAPLQASVAVSLPAAAPLAAADGSGVTVLLALGVAAAILVLARLLPFNRPKPPLPRPAMPLAGAELPDLQAQVGTLMERLYAASAGIRDLRKALRAIDAEWGRLRADGGVAEWRPHPGEWVMTPIHPSLFEAIDLPDTLRIIERQGGGRNGDMLGDLLRGLSVEPERASSAEDLLARLRWWNGHFRQYYAR